MFYLTTHSTHFYLRLYGVRHMVKDHSDSERGNPLQPHGKRRAMPISLYCGVCLFLISVPTSGPQLVYQRPWYVLLLLIKKSSLCGGSGFPSKKCVNVTI